MKATLKTETIVGTSATVVKGTVRAAVITMLIPCLMQLTSQRGYSTSNLVALPRMNLLTDPAFLVSFSKPFDVPRRSAGS